MGWGVISKFPATMASAGTTTNEIDLSRGWSTVYLEIPSMTSNSQIHIQAANASGGTYRRVYHPQINSATVAVNVYTIASSVTTAIVPIPAGLRFVKIETTATIDNGCVFNLICND